MTSEKNAGTLLRHNCPNCNTTLKFPVQKSGARVGCPKCKQELQLPTEHPVPDIPVVKETIEVVPADRPSQPKSQAPKLDIPGMLEGVFRRRRHDRVRPTRPIPLMLMAGGLAGMYFSFVMDTTVELQTYAKFTPFESTEALPPPVSNISNMSLMQQQLMYFIASTAVFTVGLFKMAE